MYCVIFHTVHTYTYRGAVVEKHKFNHKESLEVYEKCKHYIEQKQCYTNVFYTIAYYHEKFNTGEWKIAYGYINIFDNGNLMARHCYIVNEDNEAIDVTLFELTNFNKENYESDTHYSFKIFDSVDEYLEEVERNSNYPDLIKPLWNIELKIAHKWAKDKGKILIQ